MHPNILTFDIPKTEIMPAHRVVCTCWGNPQNPPIICVHGLTRNNRDFDFLAESLATNYHVICPDMPGRGKSSWLENPVLYNYGTYVADMHFIISALKLSSVSWIGTSMGGIIGMMLANAVPGAIRALILNDIGITVSAAGLSRISNYAGVNMTFATRSEAENALRVAMSTFGIYEEQHWQHLFEYSLITADDCSTRLSYDPKIMTGFPKGEDVKDIDLSGLWEALKTIPVMLIRGAQSDLLTQDTARVMQASHPQLTYHEIENAGHAPALMDGTHIRLIQDWLN